MKENENDQTQSSSPGDWRSSEHTIGPSDDESLEEDEEEQRLALQKTLSHASLSLDVSEPTGKYYTLIAELITLCGLLGVQIALYITPRTQFANTETFAAGITSWSYILVLVFVRLYTTRCSLPGIPHLWSHTAFLYGFHWICAWPIFRSAIIHPRSMREEGLNITHFSLTTILVLITLFVRKGNKAVAHEIEHGLKPSREPTASLFSRATFSWVDAIVWQGYIKTYEIEDVWNLSPRDKAAAVLADFKQLQKTSSLAWHLMKYFKRDLLLQAAWAVGNGLVTFAPTLLLKAIIEYVEDPVQVPANTAWTYVILLMVLACMEAIMSGQALWRGRKICIRLRAVIVGEIYAKALRRRAAASADKVLGEKKKDDSRGTRSWLDRLLLRKQKADASSDEEGTSPPKDKKADTQVNTGTIINLMAVDSFKVSEICGYLHFLWATSPVQVIICIVLLYRLLGFSSFAGIGVMVLVMPLNLFIAKQFAKTSNQIMKATDARIHSTNEVLQNIRIIKYFAWENRFSGLVDEKREAELKAIRGRFVVWTFAAAIWSGIPLLISFFSFMLYTVVEKKPLIPSIAFTAISLFSLLRVPLDQIADMIAHVQETKVSVDRVEEFLNEEETSKYEQLRPDFKAENDQRVIGFTKATFTWAGKDSEKLKETFRMINLDVDFKVGKLNIVAGPTGSGKTSLLMALLGEMTLLEGSVSLPSGRHRELLPVDLETGLTESVAYCAQQAWLINDNIKQNILFASPFDQGRYQSVIDACALRRDLEILDEGDATLVGEKGISLSGGQKQRISLARALYCKARHVLLDDCLSAVDSDTAQHIFHNCIKGPLMMNRTCILVTHNIALTVPQSHFVVALNNGKLVAQGPPEDVLSSGALGDDLRDSQPTSKTATAVHSRSGSKTDLQGPDRKAVNGNMNGHANGHTNGQTKGDGKPPSDEQKAEDNKANTRTEGKVQGRVKFSIMKMYISAMGPWWYWIVAATLFVLQQVLSIVDNIWIREWSNAYNVRKSEASKDLLHIARHHGTFSSPPWTFAMSSLSHRDQANVLDKYGVNVAYYLGVFGLLGIIYMILSVLREAILFYGALRAARRFHNRLLEAVTRAKFSFFDSTPLGQLMNRFSKDLEAIDQEVAPNALGVLSCLASVISIVILISVITPGFLVAAFFISLLYFAIGKFYLSSSTDLKRLESVNRSPLYQQFGETLSGATTIRAYGDQDRFIRDNLHRVDTQNRPFIYLWAANRWLALRMDFSGALVSFFAGVFIILSVGKVDPGAAGLSLTYAITFTENVLWLVRLYSTNEQSMNSVERVKEYLEVEQEAKAILPESRPPGNWPNHGAIEFIKYSTRYRPELNPVLQNLSFEVRPGERIGIVGRTGAGKSSLTLAIFRGLEADEGKILIDGIDIGLIGLQDLRENITIVPQDPTLFTGTVRSNLDPFNLFSDEEIFAILRKVHLIDDIPTAASSYPPVTASPKQSDTKLKTSSPASSSSSSPHPSNHDRNDTFPDLTLKPTDTNTGAKENINPFLSLSSPIAESGSNISQGQRQLLCLARALLKSSKILIMDEATASIDYATDAKIQETLRSVKGNTVITIAHRLKTVVDYDRVLVLDKGKVVEYAEPWDLLRREGSAFRGMCELSGEWDALMEGAAKRRRRGGWWMFRGVALHRRWCLHNAFYT